MAILLEKQDFSDIYDLLEASFPHSEFREREAQAALFDKAPYRVYGLREGEKLLALCALWELPGWRYLEHLAVAPEARNGGLGGAVSGRPDGGPALRAGSGAAGNGPGPAARRLLPAARVRME